MTAKCCVDTNVLVYSRDPNEPDKRGACVGWLEYLWKNRNGRVSYQVLQEYYVAVTRKIKPGLPKETARLDVVNLKAWQPLVIDRETVERAWGVRDRFNYAWWDALIIAVALILECDYLLTEDLQENQVIDHLTIINPVLTTPEVAG